MSFLHPSRPLGVGPFFTCTVALAICGVVSNLNATSVEEFHLHLHLPIHKFPAPANDTQLQRSMYQLTRHLNTTNTSATTSSPRSLRTTSRWANQGQSQSQSQSRRASSTDAASGSNAVVHRQELVAWLNNLLQLNITKVEQCGTGCVRPLPRGALPGLPRAHSHTDSIQSRPVPDLRQHLPRCPHV